MTATATQPLVLQEALAAKPSGLNADGTVNIHIIRPCDGRGLGSHRYEAEMLEANAGVFSGWKMFIDHQSPEAKKAAGGLPRSIRDLGGRILESFWDPNVPASGQYGQGAVVGVVKPVGQVKALIEEDPELLEASIRANATEVHPVSDNGQEVWVVEGISSDPPGSVDWVSEGGAGGRVVTQLVEGLVHKEAQGGDPVKQLEEALADPESEASKAVRDVVRERTAAATSKLRERHQTALEEAVATAREEGKAEGEAQAKQEALEEAERKLALRDKRDAAHNLIEGANLPSASAGKLKREYELDEDGKPTSKLKGDEEEDEDLDGLKERVKSDIREAKELIAEIAPTLVEGQGPVRRDGETAAKPAEKPFYREFLEEAGVDPDIAYGTKETA